jgi:hypothetical protein
MDIWYSSYASGICLAAYVLLQEDLQAGQTEGFGFSSQSYQPALASVPWFRIDKGELNLSDDKLTKLLTMIHTLAIRAVSYFAVELRRGISSGFPLARGSCTGTFNPPLLNKIPIALLLELSDPFADNSLADFPTCHLARMTDPAFIKSGTWTGSKSMTGIWARPRDWYDPIGGFNSSVTLNNLQNPQPHLGMPGVETTLRFEFVEWTASNRYKMRSNWSQTSIEIFAMELDVDRETGLIEIDNTGGVSGYPMGVYYGIMTAFGIVAWKCSQSFMWLWKTEWAVPCT